MNLFDVYPLYDICPVKGLGSYVWDEKGTKYLDFYGGHAVISIGHSHPHYITKITEQLHALAFYSNSIVNPLQSQLADLLGELSGCQDYQLFLCNSGAEANENALKMASFENGRKKIIAFKKAFHGRTSAAVNVTDSKGIQAPINSTFEVVYLPLNDFDALEKAFLQTDIAAVIIEGIQGIGGIHIPEKAFLQKISTLCQGSNTVLILDEIQSGYGRSGSFFAFQKAGIQPDIISMAKGMGNGFPIGGILLHPRFKAKHGLLGTTFGGSHLACAAGIAVLEVIRDEKLMEHAAEAGRYLLNELKTSALPGVVDVRGEGLMIGIEFDYNTATLRKKLLIDKHIFTGSSSDPNTIRLLPSLTVSNSEIEQLLSGLKSVLHTNAQSVPA
ncbi:MAG: aminotransferase class III-fold pyridoxal phosphate-dependent enzyme [Bacteroidetes bacterium]|nr:aminotransferase class III-fold pyridoxal phosphate-dependent enzyme [Bacteroidota bacterium]